MTGSLTEKFPIYPTRGIKIGISYILKMAAFWIFVLMMEAANTSQTSVNFY
jgi:hypothetical protein